MALWPFRSASGNYVTLPEPPNAYPKSTFYSGMNNMGQFVGGYIDAGVDASGFLYSISSGSFTKIRVPSEWNNNSVTQAYGINDIGQIVGWYQRYPNDDVGFGFLLSGGTYTPLKMPSPDESSQTFAGGINNLGDIIGYYGYHSGQTFGTGFLFSDGICTDLPFSPLGINYRRQIVGLGGGGVIPYFYSGGACKPPDLPTSFEPFGINNKGQIVGEIWSDKPGFLATP
jgi:hypothetical protein